MVAISSPLWAPNRQIPRKGRLATRISLDKHTLPGNRERAYTDADKDIRLQTLMLRLPARLRIVQLATASLV